MPNMLKYIFIICLISTAQVSYSAQLLRHNPFKKPLMEIVIPETLESHSAHDADHPESWYPQLRATMRAGTRSMANINGEIIKIGGQVDGFKLIQVYERKALFTKNGREYLIDMDLQYYDEE